MHHVWGEFGILLPEADAFRVFGDKLKLPCISTAPQVHLWARFIISLPSKPNEGTPIANNTTDMEVALESMEFVRAFPRILEAIWEADLDKGPVWVPTLDMRDAYN